MIPLKLSRCPSKPISAYYKSPTHVTDLSFSPQRKTKF